MEENSISIINRSNTQLTGEKTQALPVKFVGNLSWLKIFILGFLASFVFMFIFITTIKSQVVVVQVAGKSTNYQEYQIQ